MSFNDFEEIFRNYLKTTELSKEEKERIYKYIIKKERRANIILSLILISISIILILIIPFKYNIFDPVYVLTESEKIKNFELNFELYLTNPIFLIQLIYYFIVILIATFTFVFIRTKIFIKGGKSE